jgi:hypothetical protein
MRSPDERSDIRGALPAYRYAHAGYIPAHPTLPIAYGFSIA